LNAHRALALTKMRSFISVYVSVFWNTFRNGQDGNCNATAFGRRLYTFAKRLKSDSTLSVRRCINVTERILNSVASALQNFHETLYIAFDKSFKKRLTSSVVCKHSYKVQKRINSQKVLIKRLSTFYKISNFRQGVSFIYNYTYINFSVRIFIENVRKTSNKMRLVT